MAPPRPSRRLTFALAAALAVPTAALAQDAVGVASAVNPAATSQPPGIPVRTLVLGSEVVFNEKIRTEAEGQAQLVFLDRSSLSVGPSSEVVIDEFVYDKDAGTGRLAASATKGVFRYVGGAISKNADAVKLKTPTATIGIRGGVALISVAPEGGTTVTFLYGKAVTVSTASGSVQLVRPGFSTTVGGQGTAPTAPVQVPSAQLAGAMAQLDGRPGASGGAGEAPTPVLVQRSGFAEHNSADVGRSSADASRAQPAAAPPPPPTGSPGPAAPNQMQTTTQLGAVSGNPSFPPFVASFLLDENHLTLDQAMHPVDRNGELLLDLARSGALASLTDPGDRPAGYKDPETGVATYRGFLVAAVSDAGVRSISRGTFDARLDFTNQHVDFTMNNVGGRNFTGSGSTGSDGGIAFAGPGTAGVVFGQSFPDGHGRPAQTLLGDFFIQPSPGTPVPLGGTPAAPDPNGFYATGFFEGTQNSFNDPFAPLTAYIVGNVDLSTTLPAPSATPAVNLPTTGSFTYSGIAKGAVSIGGGAPASASGAYSGTFDFGSRTGTVAISGFGGQNFGGSVSASRDGSFAGALAGGGGAGSIRGGFFDNGTVAAAQQAGSFAVQGPSLLASGRFVGTR